MTDPLAETIDKLAEAIAREQVHAFAVLLADELTEMQTRASGAVNQRDLWHAVNNATRRYAERAD